jgi:outer membrane protein OmpA-like peptidoglycan-associated protein
VLAGIGGCAGVVTDRVILLPQPDGKASALEVNAGSQRLLLAQPYATAELRGGSLQSATSTAASVRASYDTLLAQLPARPRAYTVQFEPNGNRLAPGADAVLLEMRTALALLPAAEVVITGHTDRVGTDEANDRLSLARAEAVREILVAGGVARSAITVAGRGEREPVVPTADEVAEARNRRVEIKIR